MLKFFALLTGDRYEQIQRQDPLSRKKVVTMGMGLLIVTGYWLVTGFTIAAQVLHMATWPAICLAIVCAALVFGIDRSIVLTNGGGRRLILVRVAMAFILALLGGAALDLVLLKSEVDQELVTMHAEARTEALARTATDHASRIKEAEGAAREARYAMQDAETNYLDEINGSYTGSGRYGVGKVAAAKLELLEQHRAALQDAERSLAAVRAAHATAEAGALERLAQAQSTPALFDRVHAMHRYVSRDSLVLTAWLLLTLLLIFVELIPVLVKYGQGKTAYELELEAVHALRCKRSETLLRARQAQLQRLNDMTPIEHEAMSTLAAVAREHAQLN